MKKPVLLMSAAWGAIALLGGVAVGAPSATPAPANDSAADSTTVGEIVVTAEKREANLQDVPESVTAFTAKDRNTKGISTIQDMTDFTPGLTYSSQLDRPAMRGLSRDTNIYVADSSVAVYYDDFFSNSTFLVGRDDMLIDQVEVLLGPQGTLYGRNAIGGLINTISKRPTSELSGEVRVIEGNYDYTKVEGTISGPIPMVEGLSFRLSGYLDEQSKGYLVNTVPGMPTEGGVRHDPYGDFQLQYKGAKDELWLDVNSAGFNNDRGGPGALQGTPTVGPYGTALTTYGQLVFNPNYPYGGGAVPGSVYYGGVNVPAGGVLPDNPSQTNIRDFAHAIATNVTVNKDYTVNFHWIHHFDGVDVKYVGGYSQYHYELHTSYFNNDDSPITQYQIPLSPTSLCGQAYAAYGPYSPCQPLTVSPAQEFSFTTQTDWWSHEITFSSTWNKPVQWIGGLYYYNESDNNPEDFQELGQSQIGAPAQLVPTLLSLSNGGGVVPAAANPSRNYLFLDYQDRIQSAAAYGQVDWKITPTLKLTGGLRYTVDWKHATEEARYIYFGADPLAGTPYAGLLTPQNLGSQLPAFDITTSEISFASGKGICSLPTLQMAGPFAGDYSRCLSDRSSALTGTAGVEWTPDADTLVYLRYNRGYKAFAFNAGFLYANPEAAPEHVDDFEVGFKKNINHTLIVNADGFYYNYNNDQVPIGVASGAATLTEFINIPRAVSAGVELAVDWRPIRHLDLNLTYGFDRTTISSNCVSTGGVATGACYEDALDPYAGASGARPVGSPVGGVALQGVKGDALPQSPENKVAFNANYTWVFDPGNLTLSGTYIWKDKSYSSIFTRTYYEAPSWSQVNMRLMWSGQHDRYEVVLYVNNLFDTLGYDAAVDGYITGSNAAIAQAPSYDLTPPRTYGVELHYKF